MRIGVHQFLGWVYVERCILLPSLPLPACLPLVSVKSTVMLLFEEDVQVAFLKIFELHICAYFGTYFKAYFCISPFFKTEKDFGQNGRRLSQELRVTGYTEIITEMKLNNIRWA